MGSRKSNKKKLEEGRCQGIGPDYVPFHKSTETRGSRASSPIIPDPIEDRQIHCLSDTESWLYYLLRWNQDVLHIREQYLLDINLVNEVREKLGYTRAPKTACFTTDFLVDYADGSRKAFSVKFRKSDFDPNSRIYRGRPKAYKRLIMRQNTERAYWEAQGVEFHIITRDDLMPYRILIKNIAFALGFWNEDVIYNKDQMVMYLVAHRIIDVPMDQEFINPRKLVEEADFDVEEIYKRCLHLRRELLE